MPGVEILILDPEGKPVGVDEPGELVHRGAFVNLGYYNRPKDTARVFRPNPLAPVGLMVPDTVVFSGDIVRRDAEGFLYFVERWSNFIKTRGYRVGPEEIEIVINACPGVKVGAVAGRPTENGDEEIVALLELEDWVDRTDVIERVAADLRQTLPPHMLPVEFVIVDAIPGNANGKINRGALKSLAQQRTSSPRSERSWSAP